MNALPDKLRAVEMPDCWIIEVDGESSPGDPFFRMEREMDVEMDAVGRRLLDEIVRRYNAAADVLSYLEAFCQDHTTPCGCENCAVIARAKGEKS